MKALLRGFLAGFGFALGASVAGTLIGYGLGKLGEASVKRLLSPERTSSPAPSSSQPSSEQLCGESDGQGHTCTLCNCGAGEKYGCANRSMHDPDCRWRIQWVESWRRAPTRPADWDAEAARETMHHSAGSVVPSGVQGGSWVNDETGVPGSYTPGDDEDDGGDYFRALDRHDDAQN